MMLAVVNDQPYHFSIGGGWEVERERKCDGTGGGEGEY